MFNLLFWKKVHRKGKFYFKLDLILDLFSVLNISQTLSGITIIGFLIK